jgi:hypothetical protein
VPNKLVFIHIPKCGGNSVEAKLKFNNVPFTRMEPGIIFSDIPAPGLITGHLTYEQFTGVQGVAFFSVIREPLARATSQYFYNMKIKDESPEYAKMKDMTLEDYLMEHNNTMCIQLFGREMFENSFNNARLFKFCREKMDKNYMFIGALNNFGHVDLWLAKMFGSLPFEAHENRNDYQLKVSGKVQNWFMERNTVDYMLYNFVGAFWENANYRLRQLQQV